MARKSTLDKTVQKINKIAKDLKKLTTERGRVEKKIEDAQSKLSELLGGSASIGTKVRRTKRKGRKAAKKAGKKVKKGVKKAAAKGKKAAKRGRKKGSKMSAAARKRISAAMKERWAAKKGS